MNIVHIVDYFDPDAGYEPNLLSRIQAVAGHAVSVVAAQPDHIPAYITGFFGTDRLTERDNRFTQETGVTIIREPTLGYYSGRAIFYRRIFRTVSNLTPDVVLIHGLDTLTAICFIGGSRSLGFPIVVDSHSLAMSSVNSFRSVFRFFYRHFMAPILIRRNIPIVRFVDDDFLERHLGIPLSRTVLLSFGTDTDLFTPEPLRKAELRRQIGLPPNSFVAVYAGKLDEYKGGLFLAQALRTKFETATMKEVAFLIVGNTVGEYGQEVEETFLHSENTVVRLPTQRYPSLPNIYQAADIALFPKQCSLSFFDVQSCGLPVLFEDNDVNLARTTHGSAATFKTDDIGDFRAKLTEFADMPVERLKFMSQRARECALREFDFGPTARKFTDILAAESQRFKEMKQTRE